MQDDQATGSSLHKSVYFRVLFSKVATFKHRAQKHINLCVVLQVVRLTCMLASYMLESYLSKHDVVLEQ